MQNSSTGHIQEAILLHTAQGNHKHTPEAYGSSILFKNIPVKKKKEEVDMK